MHRTEPTHAVEDIVSAIADTVDGVLTLKPIVMATEVDFEKYNYKANV